jgi:hypothetical protein
MSQKNWNQLLSMKSLPFGSIYPVADRQLETRVIDMITKQIYSGCLNDVDINQKFLDRYWHWNQQTINNDIIGIDRFQFRDFTQGTTETFNVFCLSHCDRRLRTFRGEYMYWSIVNQQYFKEFAYLEDQELLPTDVVAISLPFANNGGAHPDMTEILEKCNRLKIPVLIDCSYLHLAGGLVFDFSHPCIQVIAFSLSKAFPGAGHLRIGMRLTAEKMSDPISVYNGNNYTNRLSAAVGLEYINGYSPDYNYNQYRSTQIEFCRQLEVDPSPTVVFGLSTVKYPEYNRGGKENRLCFSQYLKSRTLPMN